MNLFYFRLRFAIVYFLSSVCFRLARLRLACFPPGGEYLLGRFRLRRHRLGRFRLPGSRLPGSRLPGPRLLGRRLVDLLVFLPSCLLACPRDARLLRAFPLAFAPTPLSRFVPPSSALHALPT